MAKLIWDQIGEKIYETGVEKGVLYPQNSGIYPKGTAWNGVTAINESPGGAESNKIYANDNEYGNLLSKETYGFTIEAYTYPDEWTACDGSNEVVKGMYVRQQTRTAFGLSFVTLKGNDEKGTDFGYKLHLVYGALASPSSNDHSTVNDSPEAATMSWECSCTPIASVGDLKPTAKIEIDSTVVDKTKLKELEDILYGTDDTEARLPLPAEVATILGYTG